MSAVFRLTGSLKSYANNSSEVEIQAGQTVRQALLQLKIPPEIIALVLVNGQPQDKDYLIQENDLIQLLAVIGGG